MWWVILGLGIVLIWCALGWLEEHLPLNDKHEYDDRD